jgi:hypothetical protein
MAKDRYTAKVLSQSQSEEEGTKILFVSACHSQRIAELLQDSFRIPIAIYVEKDFQVADETGI